MQLFPIFLAEAIEFWLNFQGQNTTCTCCLCFEFDPIQKIIPKSWRMIIICNPNIINVLPISPKQYNVERRILGESWTMWFQQHASISWVIRVGAYWKPCEKFFLFWVRMHDQAGDDSRISPPIRVVSYHVEREKKYIYWESKSLSYLGNFQQCQTVQPLPFQHWSIQVHYQAKM